MRSTTLLLALQTIIVVTILGVAERNYEYLLSQDDTVDEYDYHNNDILISKEVPQNKRSGFLSRWYKRDYHNKRWPICTTYSKSCNISPRSCCRGLTCMCNLWGQNCRRSIFPQCLPLLTFIGPEDVYEDEDDGEYVKSLEFNCTLAVGTSALVVECFNRFGFNIKEWTTRLNEELRGPSWDCLFVTEKCGTFRFDQVPKTVKINKLPGVESLCRKDKLCRNYKKMRTKFGEGQFNFFPDTFNLPEELEKLNGFKDVAFILKPPAQSCGNGIKIVTDLSTIPSRSKNLVVQRYLTNPFLIDGLKFDLRLYLLITGVNPLKMFLYNDGLVRFATRFFTMNPAFLSDSFRHLTNFSVNKYNPDFEHNEDPFQFSGHKRSYKSLLKYLEENSYDVERLEKNIRDVIIKTVMTSYDEIIKEFGTKVDSDYKCYKLFGVDIILDDKLKPWLLELNNFPSLEPNLLDRHVNEPMIAEMFNIVGFHVPNHLNEKKRKNLVEKYNLEDYNENYPEFYSSNCVHNNEETKENLPPTVSDDVLQGKYLRIILRAEEELEASNNFIRLLPAQDSAEYLKFSENFLPYDKLLNAWEIRYSEDRSKGREVLKNLCSRGLHLKEMSSSKEIILGGRALV